MSTPDAAVEKVAEALRVQPNWHFEGDVGERVARVAVEALGIEHDGPRDTIHHDVIERYDVYRLRGLEQQ